ncbi:integrase catalytic subunit [Gordonia sp. KTR9]|nr:integrase catalytic subunit [Gordonia sp. KTR9]
MRCTTAPRRVWVQPVRWARPDRDYPNRISAVDVETISAAICAGWARGQSVLDTFAHLWDDGCYLGSLRSWYRIANRITDQSQRPVLPQRRMAGRRRAPVGGVRWSV